MFTRQPRKRSCGRSRVSPSRLLSASQAPKTWRREMTRGEEVELICLTMLSVIWKVSPPTLEETPDTTCSSSGITSPKPFFFTPNAVSNRYYVQTGWELGPRWQHNYSSHLHLLINPLILFSFGIEVQIIADPTKLSLEIQNCCGGPLYAVWCVYI